MRSIVFFFLLCIVFGLEAQSRESKDIPERPVRKLVPVFPIPDTAYSKEKAYTGKTAVTTENPYRTQRLIMGKGEAKAEHLAAFLLYENKNADRDFTERLAEFYIVEAETEGINHDIAFAQMCLETGFLRFGGLVSPEQNNFCGLGSIGPGITGESFPSVEIGVRAHIQHLKAYASEEPLKGELVDPRYRLVRLGSSPAIKGLVGSWAADTLYAEKIERILGRLYLFRDEYSRDF